MEGIKLYNEILNINEIVNSDEYIRSDESLMICDLTDILKKYNLWMEYMPRVKPFYAVKCNDNQIVLNFLASLGTGFDCASKVEIEKILSMNIDPNRIIFAHPTKLPGHLRYAKEQGVTTMTFDNNFELHKIKEMYPEANVVLRICCEAKKALCPLGGKFGCEPKIVAPKLLTLAKSLNLNVVGVSFHVGSNCLDAPVYDEAIRLARELFDLGKELGLNNMNLLDIGGGFPGADKAEFVEISEIVNTALDRYFPGDDVRFIAEPGRYFVTSAFQLICKIHSKREITVDGHIKKVMYYLNDGLYGSLNGIYFDHYKPIPKIIKYGKSHNHDTIDVEDTYKSTIWGPTCDALDVLCENIYLPNLTINDAIVFDNLGAYSLPVISGFNGFQAPKVKFYFNRNYNISDLNFISNRLTNLDEGICSQSSGNSSSSDSNDGDSSDDECNKRYFKVSSDKKLNLVKYTDGINNGARCAQLNEL